MKSALFIGTATCALLAPGPTSAFGDEPFFAVSGGLNFVAPITLTPSSATYDPRDLEFDAGFVGSASFGHRLNGALRIEGELSYRDNTIAGVTIQTEGPQILNGGSIRAFGIMANGWIDIPTGTRVTPYFGGGAGGAHINLAVDTSLGGGAGCTPCTHIDYDGSDWVFAYQFGAGIGIANSNGAEFTFDYRYFHADGFTVPATLGPGGPGTTTDYSAHSAMCGRLRVGKGFLNDIARAGRSCHVFGLLMRRLQMAAGHNALREIGSRS